MDLAALPPLLRYAVFAGAFLVALALARLILHLAKRLLSMALTLALALGLLYLFFRFIQ